MERERKKGKGCCSSEWRRNDLGKEKLSDGERDVIGEGHTLRRSWQLLQQLRVKNSFTKETDWKEQKSQNANKKLLHIPGMVSSCLLHFVG